MVTINYLREENRASRGDGGDETLTRRGRDPPVGRPSRSPFRERSLLRLARASERASERARVDGTIDRDPTCRRARELL